MSARRPTSNAGAMMHALAGMLCVAAAFLLLWSVPALAAAPPVVGAESVSNVAAASATLEAQIDPEGAETAYRFEYGTSEAYGASIPLPDGSIGVGSAMVTVSVHTQSLQPHTTYHFRVVATSVGGTVDGVDQSFTTQTAGGELALPDGRQWELVSPPVKDGARILPHEESGVIQGADDGSAISYLTTAPVEANPAGNGVGTQVLSRRGDGSWFSQDIATPHNAPLGVMENGSEYQLFSADLSLGLVEPFDDNNPPLSAEATERTPYLRDDFSGSYRPLLTAATVQPGVEFGDARFIGGTPDLDHVILRSSAALTSPPIENGIYEWGEGRLQLISVLPASDGGGQVGGASLGYRSNDVRNAISNDGSRVVWEANVGGAIHLFMRDVAKQETIQLDSVQGGSGAGEATPQFQTASRDGSKIFFTDTQQLTATASSGQPDLYEFDVAGGAGELAGTLTDLTVDENTGESADVVGLVLGSSEDGSYVYFAANGVLAPGAVPGQCQEVSPPGATCNLYARHDGRTTFIASLSAEDANWAALSFFGEPSKLTARVSPSGRYLAFMSDRSLTGYDNRDANSGVPDEEVYLYDAEAGHLVCASCNPTGARPVGIEDSASGNELLAANERNWGGHWLAANVPGWTATTPSRVFYQTRYLADSGRLFFNSSDALVAQDTNDKMDVYEYEPAGIAGCEVSSTTFSESTGGCVDLISAGSSAEESVFLDASTSGDDVFFLTTSRLVPQDVDTAFDVYDAHVCSVDMPCPTSGAAPPPCTTADSCRAAPSPQPAIFGAPASATFTGAAAPPTVKPTVKSKRSKKAKAKPKRAGRRAKPKQTGKRAKPKQPDKRAKSKRAGKHAQPRQADGRAKPQQAAKHGRRKRRAGTSTTKSLSARTRR